MKFLFGCIAVLSFHFNSLAQSISANDSLKIRAIIDDWDKGWIIKDYLLATKGYSTDARFTNAFGDKRNGQKEVEALLKEVFALPFVMSGKSETTEHRYQVISNQLVIVHTAVIRKGQQMPDGSVLPDRMTTHMRVFQQDRNGWAIKAHLISDARDKQSPKH